MARPTHIPKGKEDKLILALTIVFLIAAATITLLSNQDAASDEEVFYSLPPAAGAARENLAAQAMTRLVDNTREIGDVNGDGLIDPDDEALLRSIERGDTRATPEHKAYGDVDDNGRLDSRDRQILEDYLHGKISRVPVMFGDLDADRRVTPDDALLLSSFLDGFSSLDMDQLYLSDLNLDGIVDETDKDLLLAKLR
ncbi:MAG: dockerin type I domain-containing protein [archaeon]